MLDLGNGLDPNRLFRPKHVTSNLMNCVSMLYI